MLLDYYFNKLGNIPEFLKPYLEVNSLKRLKNVGYFCGMDYASKDVYNFKEYITRYDHSLSVALLTYKLTDNKKATIAALFHDVATPCFSHVIDYMNKDYEKQESTEEYTEKIIRNDKELVNLLNKDHIYIEDVIDFKQYSIVDNERPKLCADRLDGIILTGISWTKDITYEDIDAIIDSAKVYNNEYDEEEIGFVSEFVGKRVFDINENINYYCHSNEDNFMMELLAKITKYAISKKIITYDNLYILDEEDIIALFEKSNDTFLKRMMSIFKNIKKEEIPIVTIENVKERLINPLVNGKRINKSMKMVLN